MSNIEHWRGPCGLRLADCASGELIRERVDLLGVRKEWEKEHARLTEQLAGAVSLLRNAKLILSDHGEEDGDDCLECREMVREIDAYLQGQ